MCEPASLKVFSEILTCHSLYYVLLYLRETIKGVVLTGWVLEIAFCTTWFTHNQLPSFLSSCTPFIMAFTKNVRKNHSIWKHREQMNILVLYSAFKFNTLSLPMMWFSESIISGIHNTHYSWLCFILNKVPFMFKAAMNITWIVLDNWCNFRTSLQRCQRSFSSRNSQRTIMTQPCIKLHVIFISIQKSARSFDH